MIISGPNGAGKTTFAREYLTREGKIVHFVNTDLIAGGLSPLRPDLAAIAAGRLFLQEIDRLAANHANFAFESTLSGRVYAARIQRWKAEGYRIEIIYLTVPSARIALRRIAARVRQGGHAVAPADVLRRFQRSWTNFVNVYRPLADAWLVYDNAAEPKLIDEGPK